MLGSDTHASAREWLQTFRQKYVQRGAGGEIDAVTLYYDPELDRQMAHNTFMGLAAAWYLVPQDADLAHELYDVVKQRLRWGAGGGAIPRSAMFNILGLLLAQEFGDAAVAAALRSALERMGEPRDFGDGEFGYFFHLGEPWPRGQSSALLVTAEVLAEGQWRAVFARTPEQHAARLLEPTVEGVDFPSLGISSARNDLGAAALHVETYAASPSSAGRDTSFCVVQLPQQASRAFRVFCDGAPHTQWQRLSDTAIKIHTDIGAHSFRVEWRPDARL